MFELFHRFKGTVINLYIVTSSCVLISRHERALSFISIYFQSNLLASNYESFCSYTACLSQSVLFVVYSTAVQED